MSDLMTSLATAVVSFPKGATEASTTVLATLPLPAGRGLVLATSPFHPESHSWPDQPGDHGTIEVDGAILAVTDTVTGALSRDGEVLVGADIPVRKFEEGWHFFPVLFVPDAPELAGAEVVVRVDGQRRAQLSAHHTAEHLMALALNQAIAQMGGWKKEPPRLDSLGSGDFDQLALNGSRISTSHAWDTYRFGKSLRRKGLKTTLLLQQCAEVGERVQSQLDEWVAADAAITLDVPSPALSAVRTWRCRLPEGEVAIPCGGTHLSRTGLLRAVRVRLVERDDMPGLTARTEVVGCAP
jgi:alanyl-tRNA synthetase